MNRLWAPWRKAYIRPKSRRIRGCLFCGLIKKHRDSKDYILQRTSHSFAVLNLYPYNNGHVMIVPKRHVAALEDLSDKEKLDWLSLYDRVLKALRKELKPDGFNAGFNLDKSAGAGVPDHIHLHVVPRWQGDTNFMPVIGKTKVISESLDSVYTSVKRALKKART